MSLNHVSVFLLQDHSAYVIENEFDKVTDLTAYLSDWFAETGRIYPFEY